MVGISLETPLRRGFFVVHKDRIGQRFHERASRELRRVDYGQYPYEQNASDGTFDVNDTISLWPGTLGVTSSIHELRAGLVTGREKNRLL